MVFSTGMYSTMRYKTKFAFKHLQNSLHSGLMNVFPQCSTNFCIIHVNTLYWTSLCTSPNHPESTIKVSTSCLYLLISYSHHKHTQTHSCVMLAVCSRVRHIIAYVCVCYVAVRIKDNSYEKDQTMAALNDT